MGTLDEQDSKEELERKINEIAEAFAEQAATATYTKIKQMLYAALNQERTPEENVVELKYTVELTGRVQIDGNQIVGVSREFKN